MRMAALLAMSGLFVLGCSHTKENLEKKGIEVHSGKVMRVFRF